MTGSASSVGANCCNLRSSMLDTVMLCLKCSTPTGGAAPSCAVPREPARISAQGKAPAIGQLFRNPDLHERSPSLPSRERAAFYKGDIAQAILKTSSELGGTMTASDLSQYSAEWVEPISTKYRDWTVYELPPNGDGMAALEMLNIMDNFKPSADGPLSVAELHTRIESMKLAYADVKAYDGDPRFASIPVTQLISKPFAAKRAALINPDKANCEVAPGALAGSDTTYLSVVDREGNILSLIQSNYEAFGSDVTVKGMGFVLQDRGGLFSVDRKSPDALPVINAHSTPSFLPSWSTETNTLVSALWEA